ncbi:MAG: GEVED domain-containing protein [Bacteroidales bacterium]
MRKKRTFFIKTIIYGLGFLYLTNWGLSAQNQIEQPNTRVAENNVSILSKDYSQYNGSIAVFPQKPSSIMVTGITGSETNTNVYGAQPLISIDAAYTWMGNPKESILTNSGAGHVLVDNEERCFMSFQDKAGFLRLSISEDLGENWKYKTISKRIYRKIICSRLCQDLNKDSKYYGRMYLIWVSRDAEDENQSAQNNVFCSYSIDHGENWSVPIIIEKDILSKKLDLKVHPNGNLYFALFENVNSSSENKLLVYNSENGGEAWGKQEIQKQQLQIEPHGIKNWKHMSVDVQVHSSPTLAIDCSKGIFQGRIYLAWTQQLTEGDNHKSVIYHTYCDNVDYAWAAAKPIYSIDWKLSQLNKSFFPSLSVDPSTGWLYALYYDNRNSEHNFSDVHLAKSVDGGVTWTENIINDRSFPLKPFDANQGKYGGDYICVEANQGYIYSLWTDFRKGHPMLYLSTIEENTVQPPSGLTYKMDESQKVIMLNWNMLDPSFKGKYLVECNGKKLGTTSDLFFKIQMEDYGDYKVKVFALYPENIKSDPARLKIVYGKPSLSFSTDTIKITIPQGISIDKGIDLLNKGTLESRAQLRILPKAVKDIPVFCDAISDGDEFIRLVDFAGIYNLSNSDKYSNYESMHGMVRTGADQLIKIYLGKGYSPDKIQIWCDWNKDGELSKIECKDIDKPEKLGFYKSRIKIPEGLQQDVYRFRIRLSYDKFASPCGEDKTGEVEDYILWINDWLGLPKEQFHIKANSSSQAYITVDSKKLSVGKYHAFLKVDYDENKSETIPICLTVKENDFDFDLTKSEGEICAGTEIFVEPTIAHQEGMTYEWNSKPGGVVSTERKLFDSPMTETDYLLTIKKGKQQASKLIEHSVILNPNAKLGKDTIICASETYTLHPGFNIESEYNWSTGSIKSSITVDSTGVGFGTKEIWVEVENKWGCISRDTVKITFTDCTKSVGEYSNEKGFCLYPNPCGNKLNISKKDITTEAYTINITNMQNILIQQHKGIVLPRSIDLSGLVSGIYLISIENLEGKRYLKKVIKM